jgi:putative ABC transport system permease protein
MVPRLTPAHGFVGPTYLGAVWLIFAGAAALLLVAVINAANLLLSRTAGRSGEIGVRMALGGSTARILRLLLAEIATVTAAGALVGLVLAWAIGQAYVAWSPERQLATGSWLHSRALVFTLTASILAAGVAACVSAWRVRAMAVRDVLAGGAGQRATADASRVRDVLVGVQAMLAVLLVSGAALMARSYGNVLAIDPGFEAEQLAVLSIRPPSRLETSEAERAFLLEVQDAFASIPGVTGVTTAGAPPFSSSSSAGLP